MHNLATALHSAQFIDPRPRGFGPLRWLREQISYIDAMRELNSLDDKMLDDIGIAREMFPALARRHASRPTAARTRQGQLAIPQSAQ